jgi:hypothetical protein
MATGKSARPVKGSASSATRNARNAGEQGGSLHENESERFHPVARRHDRSTSSSTQIRAERSFMVSTSLFGLRLQTSGFRLGSERGSKPSNRHANHGGSRDPQRVASRNIHRHTPYQPSLYERDVRLLEGKEFEGPSRSGRVCLRIIAQVKGGPTR